MHYAYNNEYTQNIYSDFLTKDKQKISDDEDNIELA